VRRPDGDGDVAVRPAPQEVLLQMIGGGLLSQAIRAAAVLGIADLLHDGPRSIGDLARSTEVPERQLSRLMRALVGASVFAEAVPDTYAQTPISACLRSDAPSSVRSVALMFGDEWQWRPWEAFVHSLRTGQPAFDHLYGMTLWQYFRECSPESGRIFDAAMTVLSERVSGTIVDAYDFSRCRMVTDIGGGEGSLLTAILRRHPDVRGIVFDQPAVMERARALIASNELEHRCDVVGGDFFECVPSGADCYVIKHTLRGWDDQGAIEILRSIRRAMDTGGRLLVIEPLPSTDGPLYDKLEDLQLMLVATGGMRTEDDYRRLFAAGGLRLARVVPTSTSNRVLEAVLL
jgi:hypothetical protein